VFQIYFEANIFEVTSDHRYFLPLLGRGPGDIAIAFYVIFIGAVFYLKTSLLDQDTKDKVLLFCVFFTFLFSIIAQSRTYILISTIFILLSYKSVGYGGSILRQRKLSTLMVFGLIFVALHVNFFGEIYKRTNYSLLSGRTDLWVLYIKNIDGFKSTEAINGDSKNTKADSAVTLASNDQSKNTKADSIGDNFGVLLGRNLERKLLIDKNSGIETSDAHNFYFDLIQTYGILGCIFLIISYFFSLRNSFSIDSLPPIVCFALVGFVMSPFKVPYLFYTNILILLIPMITWPDAVNEESTNPLQI
jgi:hypothetical protein